MVRGERHARTAALEGDEPVERVFHQAEGGTAEGLQGFVERHGTEASVRRGKRETEQIESPGIGRGHCSQLVPTAAQQVPDRRTDTLHPRGKLHRDHCREQVRLRPGQCRDQTGVASYLDIPGQQIARAQ
jgi:hypothetical protein